MTFKRPQMSRRAREPGEFDSFVPRPRAIIEHGWLRQIGAIELHEPIPKTPGRKRQAIRDAARDEECTIRIVGVCNHDRSTTVGCHFPGLAGDRGMGMKALDIAIAFGCSACHDVVDGRAPLPAGATRESVLIDYFMGHMRSLVRLAQKGLL